MGYASGFSHSRRKDDGKCRVKEDVQENMKMTQQHQANSSSCMALRLH